MTILQNSEAFKKMTSNDLQEYRDACKEIGDLKKYYEKYLDQFTLGQKFDADFAFTTSETGLFFNIRATFHVRKKRKKNENYIYFKVTDIFETTMDEYLDMINEAKKYLDEEKN
jgi:hypothetical protein